VRISAIAIERRIHELELHAQRRRTRHEPDVIMISGGLTDGVEGIATADGHSWTQAPFEGFAAFQDRVVRAAEVLDATYVVVGGMPNDEELPRIFAAASEFGL
jgi:hypothetical protein